MKVGWQDIERKAKLSDQQKLTKVYAALHDAALGSEIDSVKTAEAECDKLDSRYTELGRQSFNMHETIDKLDGELAVIERKLQRTQREIKNQSDFIDDKVTRNGIMAYKEILKATVDVFGAENMTETVICQAIVEAGYGAWRSMMGPKDELGASKRL